MKYILVIGGGMSCIGKGIVTSSIGAILNACDLKVTAIKIDPYINVDAGLFSPYEHGEVFVLNDGCEVDLDLGNYERFLDIELNSKNNITTGKIYQRVIETERSGNYLGKTVQIIPHVTNAIQDWIEDAALSEEGSDVCVIELGGTIGDIEGMTFVEALRQFRRRVKKENFCCCLLNPVPVVGEDKEPKTKPIQGTCRLMRSYGLNPDIIICRSEIRVADDVKAKIAGYSDVEVDCIFTSPDLKSIYQLPNELANQGIVAALCDTLKMTLNPKEDLLKKWAYISKIATNGVREITIALVGKYTKLRDSYTSVIKSLEHACYYINAKPKILFINSELLEESEDNQAWIDLNTAQCLIVPGGFGLRGVEGKLNAINWARKKKIPFLGICLGFQMAVIEYARNILGIKNAHSEEYSSEIKDMEPMVVEMLEYLDPERKLGGTMRLGRRKTKFVVEKSILKHLYGDKDVIEERHRHRYEINPRYIENLENNGLRFVGKNMDETRMEILELDHSVHPYFVAVQYHPEYLSRPFKPSPPYLGLIQAAAAN